jgi:hypothetical protein
MSRSNWLSFTLNDEVRDVLFDVARQISESSETILGEGITFRVGGQACITDYQGMEHEAVHMTALFIGDGLHSLKYAQLAQFHTLVSEAPFKKPMRLKYVF